MDFFSAVAGAAAGVPPTDPADGFAHALASRCHSHSAILATRLLPSSSSSSSTPSPVPMPSHSPPPLSQSSPSSSPAPSAALFVPVPPPQLPPLLDDLATLVVDIRPHAAYFSARIPHALSLSVPSTLLKRPLFSLERLSAMLPSSSARARFSAWRSASRILVYDADSASIPKNSNIYGLLKKFKSEGFPGELAWLQGGFQAVWKEHRLLVDIAPPTPDSDDDDDDHHKQLPNNTSTTSSTTTNIILRTRQLPRSAFALSSTTASNLPKPPNTSALACSSSRPTLPSRPACNPFFDTIRQNIELSHGITERIPLRLPLRVRRRIHELPFPWLQDIARRAAPRHLSTFSDSSESEEEDTTHTADVDQGTEALAMQFYRIELAEQRRLMGVMEHHSKESGRFVADGVTQASLNFPFSITAGVEKGAKNRYRHIWPFEHARVRLRQVDDDDYVNASYVQPLGTRKRYIATQGPLPATFNDFWTLCWEQNVHVIVMLTREVEGAMVKCGNYWTDGTYGSVRIKLMSTSGATTEDPGENGFFPARDREKKPTTVKKVFEVVHTGYPHAPPRRVTHLQYLEWPDMNVPDDARGVLGLVADVKQACQDAGEGAAEDAEGRAVTLGLRDGWDEKTGVAKHALGRHSPVLLHCSAGVGRTGGFIAVDAVLDAVRREMGKRRKQKDVDAPRENVDHDSLLDVMPIPVSAADEPEGANVLRVPFAPHDPMKTPMNVDGEGTDWSSEQESNGENWLMKNDGGKPSTRKWAESVSDETGMRAPCPPPPSLFPSRSSPPGTSVSSSSGPSLTCSDDSFGFGCGGRLRGGAHATRDSSSMATSVSGSTSALKSFPMLPPPWDPPQKWKASADLLPPDLRTRSFSAPSSNVPSATRLPAQALGSSPLASSSTPWLSDTRKANRSPSPFHRKLHLPKRSAPGAASQPLPPVPRSDSFGGNAPPDEPSPSISPSLAPDESVSVSGNSHLRSWSAASVSTDAKDSSPTHSIDDYDDHSHFRTTTIVDYKEPRALHGDFSPPPLSTYEEPIWQVVQDMREQRMSLCQSLRQYVFVHAAVIEGALGIVDEELAAAAAANEGSRTESPERASRPTTRLPVKTKKVFPSTISSPAKGKRGASPTELLKEDKTGGVLLSKRPSIKRSGKPSLAMMLESAPTPPPPPPPRPTSGGCTE